MDKFEIGISAQEVYDFAWTKFCDYYIETSKVTLRDGTEEEKNTTKNVLLYVLTNVLKLMHPVIPFATEEIYLSLPVHDESIMISKFPKYTKKLDFKADAELAQDVIGVIKLIRNSRSENKIADNKKLKSVQIIPNENSLEALKFAKPIIEKLCLVEDVQIVNNFENTSATIIVANICKIAINYMENVDKDAEIKRIEAQIDKQKFEIERSNKMLSNERFVTKAPKELVEAEKEKLQKNTSLLNSLEAELAKYKN